MIAAPSTSLVGLLRRDRPLAAATVLLAAAACAPLFVTPFLPLRDLPNHVGLAGLIPRLLTDEGLSATHYTLQSIPLPYWTTYVILAGLGWLAGPLAAAKILMVLVVLVPPLGLMRLMAALGRSPRLGLWAFALAWDYNVHWGFVAHSLGVGLSLLALARLVEAPTPRAALSAWPLGVLVAMTHAHATGLYLVAAFVLALAGGPVRERLKVHAVGALGPLLALVPWIAARLTAGGVRPPWPWGHQDALGQKVTVLYRNTLDNLPNDVPREVTALAFLVLLLGPLLLARRDEGPRRHEDRGVIALWLVAVAMYLALPFSTYWPVGQLYVYPRQATFLLLCGLLVPRARLDGRRAWLLLPGVAGALAVCVATAAEFRDFASRARPFEEVIAAVRPESAVLPLIHDENDPASRIGPFNQICAYVLAARGGYQPYIFDNPSHPVVHTARTRRPAPPWDRPHAFDPLVHGPVYDYVLVIGRSSDSLRAGPLGNGNELHHVLDAGRFRLYEITHAPHLVEHH